MITSKQIITVTRDDPRFDTIYEALKAHGFRIDEDTVSATFTKSDICGPIYPFDGEMSKLNEDDEQIEKYKDWIVRYYASHDDIPEGKYDGHIVRELIRCKDCDNYKHWECPVEQAGYRPMGDMYCAWAKRKTDPSDRPITCDHCKHWHGLKRDGRYWCSKHSAYMETGCEEGERKEE